MDTKQLTIIGVTAVVSVIVREVAVRVYAWFKRKRVKRHLNRLIK